MTPLRLRNRQRLYRIHQEIRSGLFPNGAALAQKYPWSEKTIRRELAYLRELNAPLVYDKRKRGFTYTTPFELPAIPISEGELLGLFLGWQFLRPYRGTDVGAQLAGLYAKLADFLPDHITVDLGQLHRSYVVSGAAAEEVEPGILEQLIKAASQQRCIDVVYHTLSRDLPGRRILEPYGFHFADGSIYLVAYCRSREEVRNFHPSRILEMTILDDQFKRPADFDIAKYVEEGFRMMRGDGPPQTITLRFSPAIARYLKVQYHPSQTKETQPGGSVLLHFRVNHTLELKRLALSFGADYGTTSPRLHRRGRIEALCADGACSIRPTVSTASPPWPNRSRSNRRYWRPPRSRGNDGILHCAEQQSSLAVHGRLADRTSRFFP